MCTRFFQTYHSIHYINQYTSCPPNSCGHNFSTFSSIDKHPRKTKLTTKSLSQIIISNSMDPNSTQPSWPELLGSQNWEGLLEPFDLDLRNLILRCGDFCQATYDAFNNDQNSKYAGSSRYGKKSFFQKVALESAPNYYVYSFPYATAQVSVPEALLLKSRSREKWDKESNWIGYIAVTSDERSEFLGRREIYVAWRGTSRDYEWVDVIGAKPESASELLNPKALNGGLKKDGSIKESSSHGDTRESTVCDIMQWRNAIVSCCQPHKSSGSDGEDEDKHVPKVMQGWLTIYTSSDPSSSFTKESARKQLLAKIKQLREQYKDENLSIVLTGHSLGASVSIVAAFDLVENGVTDIPVTAIIFGSPQVGNKAFNERLKEYANLKVLHVKNKIDMIPLYPSPLLGYVNTGVLFEIDNRKSPSLKDSRNTSDWHNLQAMLHTVAGWNGAKGKFELKVKRSLALVNKSSEILKEEYLIPGSWWVEKNKGLVLDENGEWVLRPPDDEDLPVPED